MLLRSLAFVASILLSVALGAPRARAQCFDILDPGYTSTWHAHTHAGTQAQTFTPIATGTVCEILHGLTTAGGMTAYNAWVVPATGAGAPPTNYTTSYLFRALNVTSFGDMGANPLGGSIPVTNGMTVNAGQTYALIIEPIGGQMVWRGGHGGNYAGGQSWGAVPGGWGNTLPQDFTFRVLGDAIPPDNDSCASPYRIYSLGTVNGSTIGATTDGVSACGGVGDVWYSFSAPCAGTIDISICSATFDTVISLYAACGGTELLCNDDCPGSPCSGPGSCLSFNATCGGAYRLRVASFDGTPGTFTLNLSQLVAPPANDNVAAAIPISASTPFTTCGATTDGPAGCDAFNDIWYTYTPPCQGTVSIGTCGATFDSYLAVYTGSPGNLTPVDRGCNDDDGPLCLDWRASVRFAGNPCTTYTIRVGGFGGNVGCGMLSVDCSTALAVNDGCAVAIPIGPGLTYGTTVGATVSRPRGLTPGPCGLSASTRDVWYSYRPPCNGQMTIDTCALSCGGSRFDTVLSVYTGNCGSSLLQVPGACNDDADPSCGTGYPFSSRVVANVTGGVTYKIRVSGYAGGFGDFALQLAYTPTAITNDDICSAIDLACGRTAFSTCTATTSPEPMGGCAMFNDVWYRVTSPNCTGTMILSTCNSPFDTVLAVYTGSCTLPTFLACNDNAGAGSSCANSLGSFLSFATAANTTYYIRIGSASSSVFSYGLIAVRCPTGTQSCPPPTGAALTALFDIEGMASGVPWAFRISLPCCFDRYVANVPGVATSGVQSTDEANLRDAFVAAINAACPSTPPLAVAYPFNNTTVLEHGKFGIKARHCGLNVPATLYVGDSGELPNELCQVVTASLPTMGSCSFNPVITEVELAGTDCNGNGEDDYVDILDGFSLDIDGNNVPDECDLLANGPGLAYCSGDGLLSPPTTPCPCGNVGAKRHGCASSFNPAGAAITATGVVASDSVVLVGSGMQATGISIFLQGDGIDPNAFVFGDGITCTGGQLVRLRAVALSGGASSFPVPPETITLSARGGVTVGSGTVRSYTVFYRNAAGAFCPPATFNAANSYQITW